MATTKRADGQRWKYTCPICNKPVKAHTSYSQQNATIRHFDCAYPPTPKQLTLKGIRP